MSNNIKNIIELAKEGVEKLENTVGQEIKPEILAIESTSKDIVNDVVKDTVTELSHGKIPTAKSLAEDAIKDISQEIFKGDSNTE